MKKIVLSLALVSASFAFAQKKEIQKPEGIKVFSIIDGDTIRYKDESGKLASVRLI